ncbi:CBS domain-containing protein [Blastomonas sp. SL216]|jgi:CBS domain-containing protein|uniref:CBS domain-containing protein n=1 Tax=Blastomonas sp. SL216 TaxID=2995169 RepID=UPI0023773A14|nr:CBS domain-containing protein [Blastomonas sp. SL216]
MTIAHILSARDGSVHHCTCDATVRDAANLLAEKRIGALPIVRDGEVVGIFSERDLVYRLHSDGPGILDQPVEQAMTAPAITVTPDTQVMSALSLMTRRRIRHLPVVEGTTLIGFVSIGDLVKYRIDKIESEAAALRDYIQSV